MVSMTATHKYVSNEELFFMLKLSIKYLPGSIGSTDGNLHSWLTNQKGVKASFTALLLNLYYTLCTKINKNVKLFIQKWNNGHYLVFVRLDV